MTPRPATTEFSATVPRRQLTTADIAAALVGVVAALCVLVLTGALLISGVAGIGVFEASNLERLAGSTVATAVGLVSAAFFCGGWTYGALRRREKRLGLGDVCYGEPDSRRPANGRVPEELGTTAHP